MKKIVLTAAAVAVLSACTHTKMEVTKATDSQMSCAQIAAEMTEVKMVRQGIDGKTGFSGRNVFYVLFWPAIIVNEVNGNQADKLAQDRQAKLVSLYEQKRCNSSHLTEAEKRAEAKKAADAKKIAEETNRNSSDRK